ncbi:GntR family transcriptional regulator, partial [Enterococcus faecalis]
LLAESFLHQQSEAEIQALIQKIYQNFDSKGRAL